MTPREKQIYDVLTDEFQGPGAIARVANIRTSSPWETASKFCISLTKKGFAVKGMAPNGAYPAWRRIRAKTDPEPKNEAEKNG